MQDMQQKHKKAQDELTNKEAALQKSENELKLKTAELMKEAADAAQYKVFQIRISIFYYALVSFARSGAFMHRPPTNYLPIMGARRSLLF